MATQPPAAPPAPRWTALAPVVTGMVGLAMVIVGALIAIGVWRGGVDSHLVTLDKRMDQAEADLHTYVPVVVQMQVDLRYLADRARREDDARERERR